MSSASVIPAGGIRQPNQAGSKEAANLGPGLVHSLDIAQRAKHSTVTLESSAKAQHPHALALLAAHLASDTTVSTKSRKCISMPWSFANLNRMIVQSSWLH